MRLRTQEVLTIVALAFGALLSTSGAGAADRKEARPPTLVVGTSGRVVKLRYAPAKKSYEIEVEAKLPMPPERERGAIFGQDIPAALPGLRDAIRGRIWSTRTTGVYRQRKWQLSAVG